MHPDTQVIRVSDSVGLGVVAVRPIPAGTWIWVRDPLDRELSEEEVSVLPLMLLDCALTYMYRNCLGRYVLLWDHGKYVNHSFYPNCMLTPYGLDIALRDIAAGEELTEDYGLFNVISDFAPHPEGGSRDRHVVREDDLEHYAEQWDAQLRDALRLSARVHQPLASLLNDAVRQELERFWNGVSPMRSVRELRVVC